MYRVPGYTRPFILIKILNKGPLARTLPGWFYQVVHPLYSYGTGYRVPDTGISLLRLRQSFVIRVSSDVAATAR
jgi:hypothetical protein